MVGDIGTILRTNRIRADSNTNRNAFCYASRNTSAATHSATASYSTELRQRLAFVDSKGVRD